MDDSKITFFFKNQIVFITGGTGFLGKLLIEKLLRICDVPRIYIMVRAKKGKTVQERMENFFNYPCFNRLKQEKPNFEKYVTFIEGNCEKANLGINPDFQKILMDETSVVIHAAANVKFEQPLREAANINVRSTKDVLELAKKMPLLKALIYVSTAYSNCPHSHIEEKFYDPPVTAKTLMTMLDGLDDEVLDRITPKFIVPWPNTYTFTKSIAEDLIRTDGTDLPLAIVRPAAVSATCEEPMPGWIDNFYGAAGIAAAGGLGVVRSFNVKLDNICFLVPCDFVANLVLASAWNIAEDKQNTSIYNYVGSSTNLLNWRQFVQILEEIGWDYPPANMVWYYTFKTRENPLWNKICVFFQHTVVAYIADFVLICLRRQPIAVKNYKRLDKLLDLTSYFTMNYWTFEDENVSGLWEKMGDSDRKCFKFNMQRYGWRSLFKIGVEGGRVYLLKDPLETIPYAKKKRTILAIIHYFLMAILYYLLFLFFRWVVRLLLF